MGPRRVRNARRERHRHLFDPRRVSVAAFHVRHQPRDQGRVRADHARRLDPRRFSDSGDRQVDADDDEDGFMSSTIEQLANQEYKYGFVTDIESDVAPPGLNEDIVRLISTTKNEPEWLLEWRLKALRHWLTMKEPAWANVHYKPIDYQAIRYYSAPKQIKKLNSLDEVDPELRKTFDKLGISLEEQKRLSGVAVDAVFDSVSVATTFQAELSRLGIIFCSFSEAVQQHPDLVRRYLGSVVPYTDNFFATLNSAVFSDGSFCYIPPGVRCPVELSTYFRINARDTGQFERTLIIADKGAYVSYLEGCTAPMRDENQLHAAVVELVALEGAQIRYATVQNWYPGDREGRGGSTTLSPSAASARGETRKYRGRRWRPARPSPGNTPVAFWWATTRWASSIRSR